MKILFVINQLACGGAEQQLVTLCEGLRKRHHDVSVVSIYNQLDLRERLDRLQIPIRVGRKYCKIDVTVVWRLRCLIQQAKPDIVHSYLPASALFTAMTKWLGVTSPVIQAERSINTWRSKGRLWLDTVVRRRVAGIVCNAHAIRAHLIEVERVPPQKVALIYNGLAPERGTPPSREAISVARQQLRAPFGAYIVIAVANFVKEKQHQVLLAAFARAKKQAPHMFLVLVGKGALESEIRHTVAQLDLVSSTQLITNCTNPLPLLCAADLAVLTSDIEGCSNAILEAMAMGLPLVVTDAGGNRELVTHGAGGIVCRVGDIHAVAEGLGRLAQDRQLAQVMGRYNRERVCREFTDDSMVERTLALYHQVVKKTAFAKAQ
ncbi:MAG: glycosyltransferase [Candidatus Binatia bacterium]